MRLSPKPRFRFYATAKIYPEVMKHVLTGGNHRAGDEIARLGQRVAERTRSPYALCVPQARVGLYLALSSLIQPGQRVVLSPYTHYEVVNMVLWAGGDPVFADVETDSCHIDAAAIEALIDDRTGAVIATHLDGLVCNIQTIAEVCRARNVALIEDAAQCFGGRLAGRHVGTFGDAGILSFSHVKNVNTLLGGMALIRDRSLEQKLAARLASYPPQDLWPLLTRAGHCLLGDILTTPVLFQLLTFWLVRYDTRRGGRLVKRLVLEEEPLLRSRLPEEYLRQMTPMQAGLALEQLDDLEVHAAERMAYARMYYEGLADLPEVGLPPLHPDRFDVYLQFPVQSPDRDGLLVHMMRHRRDVRLQSFRNLADEPCFERFARDCPNARNVADRTILLPTYPGYGRSEVEKNIGALRSYFGRGTIPSHRTGSSHEQRQEPVCKGSLTASGR